MLCQLRPCAGPQCTAWCVCTQSCQAECVKLTLIVSGSNGRCGPLNGPQCADCKFSFPAGAPAPAALMCSGSHAMFFYVFDSASVLNLSHSCNACKSEIVNGSVGIRCPRRDFDVCFSCLQSHACRNSSPETVARVFPLVASNSTLISLQAELKLR